MNPSEQFADWTTLRTIRVQAVATFILEDVFRRLTKLERELTAELFASDISGKASAIQQRRALREFASAIDEKIAEVYREILSRVEADLTTLAAKEDEAQRGAFLPFADVRESKPLNIAGLVILGATLKQWLSKQAGDLEFRVNQSVRQGVAAGEDTADLAKRIKGGTDKAGNEVAPVIATTKRAAEVVIRTGTTQIQTEVTEALADKLPASVDYGWQQISILDGRTTQICKSYAFKIWTKDFKPIGHSFPFAGGVPRHPNCLPGDSLVLPGGRISSVSKRWYDGDMFRITTASGYELACTPNHPILTDQGWIAAQFLQQGSRVVCDFVRQNPAMTKRKNQNGITTIEQIAEAFLSERKHCVTEMPSSAPYFHGDGAESEVAVIGTDVCLCREFDAASFKHIGEFQFKSRGDFAKGGFGFGSKQKAFNGFLPTANSGMSSLREFQPLDRSESLHSRELLFAAIANRDFIFNQNPANRGMTAFQNIGDTFYADTRSVKLDDVLSVERYSFHGNVYNIETERSYYFANGIATHNCRSRIVLYMLEDGPSKELTFRAWLDTLTPQQQTQIFGKNRIALWKAGKLTDQDLIRQQWQAINPEDINNDNDK